MLTGNPGLELSLKYPSGFGVEVVLPHEMETELLLYEECKWMSFLLQQLETLASEVQAELRDFLL
jgi:hypothetical protein